MVPSVPSCPVRVALLSILIGTISGCETYTVEYRKRPEYYANWGGEVPDRVVREDGTVVLYPGTEAVRVTHCLSTYGMESMAEVGMQCKLEQH